MDQSAPQVNFFNFTPETLGEHISRTYAEPQFRAAQLFGWVYKRGETDPQRMTNIKHDLRSRFKSDFLFPKLQAETRLVSQDGTRKYLFKVGAGDLVESVMIKQPKRMTLCISSQVGCAMGCTFCKTGTMGLKRNLETWEIVGQVMAVIEDAKNFGDMFSNIVFMGMGEPLQNLDAVVETLKILRDTNGLGLSPQRSTVSTSGLVPAIKKLGESGVDPYLAISLNATSDEVRDRIMPINKRYPIHTLLAALKDYPLKARKRITIEYVLLKGINDSSEDMKRLPKLLSGIPVKVNLIPYNLNPELGMQPPAHEVILKWQRYLNSQGLVATIRWSKGSDIGAACGQLVTSSKKERKTRSADKDAADRNTKGAHPVDEGALSIVG